MKVESGRPTEKEIPKLKKLWKQAFGDTDEYIDLFFDDLFRTDDSAVLFADGELVSMAMLIPCELFVHGEVFRISYLYAMATDEKYRGRGYGLELLRYAGAYCRERGDDGIALEPADDGLTHFYAKAGYETAFTSAPSDTEHVVYGDRYLRHIERISDTGDNSEEELLPPGMLLRLNDNIPPDICAYLKYPMN